MLQATKELVLSSAKALGAHRRVLASEWRRRRLAILCYHGISLDDEHEWDPRYYVSPARFEQRLKLLRENGYNVLPLGEAVRRLHEGSLPAKSVALTFDDGCYDFFRQAFPLLQKYGFPATVYLTTFYCRHPKPIFGMLCHYLLWKARHKLVPGELLPGFDFAAGPASVEGRANSAAQIVAFATKRGLSLPEKDRLAEQLARQLGVDLPAIIDTRAIQLMRPDEVACLARAGVDIQLHTHRHRTPEDCDLFAREIADNRRAIADMTGSADDAVHFCYPSGVYRQAFLPWLEQENVISATTCDSGLASPQDHHLLLPRIVDHSALSEIEFESWVSGVRYLLNAGRPSRAAGANS